MHPNQELEEGLLLLQQQVEVVVPMMAGQQKRRGVKRMGSGGGLVWPCVLVVGGHLRFGFERGAEDAEGNETAEERPKRRLGRPKGEMGARGKPRAPRHTGRPSKRSQRRLEKPKGEEEAQEHPKTHTGRAWPQRRARVQLGAPEKKRGIEGNRGSRQGESCNREGQGLNPRDGKAGKAGKDESEGNPSAEGAGGRESAKGSDWGRRERHQKQRGGNGTGWVAAAAAAAASPATLSYLGSCRRWGSRSSLTSVATPHWKTKNY